MPDIPFGVGPDIFEPPLPSRPLGGYDLPFNITDNDPLSGFGGSGGGGGGGGGLGALGNALSKMFGGKDGQSALALLAGLIPLLMQSGSRGPALSPEIQQGMTDAMGMSNARMRRTDPLHDAVTQLAFSRLPISARQGINLSRVALPGTPAASAGGGAQQPPSSVNPPPSEIPPDQRGPRHRNNPPQY